RAQDHGKHVAGDGEVVKRGNAAPQHTTVQRTGSVQLVGGAFVAHVVNVFILLSCMTDAVDRYFSFGEVGVLYTIYPAVVEHVAVHCLGAVVKLAGSEEGPAAFRSIQDAGQRDVDVVPDVKFVLIGD